MGAANAGGSSNGGSGARGANAHATQGAGIRIAKAERHQQAAQEYFADVMHKQVPQGRNALKTVWREPSGIISPGKQRDRLPSAD